MLQPSQSIEVSQLVAILFALIGLFGFAGMTWLFPTIARLLSRRTAKAGPAALVPVRRIAIIIPSHNEEMTLPKTLPSVQAAIAMLQKHHPEVQVDIRIGADGCTDRTVEIGRAAGADVIEAMPSRGKWKTVHELVRTSESADWIVLADAGILWPENFLLACMPYYRRADVYGVAPTYRNPTAGLVETVVWNVECVFKTLENAVGGPVSVHGPTVMYRQRELLGAIEALSAANKSWINDDVAVSLYLRLTQPDRRLVYVPAVASWDCAESHIDKKTGAPLRELNRRKRMVLGNLQWMTSILAVRWRENTTATVIAMRRVFRMLWAFWFLAFGLMAAALMGPLWTVIVGVTGATSARLVLGRVPVMMLIDAARVSLLAPYYWATGQGLASWK